MFGYSTSMFPQPLRSLHNASFWITLILVIISVAEVYSQGCGSCMSREQKKEQGIEVFKGKLLDKLRLSRPPVGPHLSRDELEKIPTLRALIRECEDAQPPFDPHGNPLDDRTRRRCVGPRCSRTRAFVDTASDGLMMDDPNAYRGGGRTYSSHDDDDDDDDARTLINVFQVPDLDRSRGSSVRFSLEGYSNNVQDLQAATLGIYLDDGLDDNFRRHIRQHVRHDKKRAIAYIHVDRNYRPDERRDPPSQDLPKKKPVTLRPGAHRLGFWIHFNITTLVLAWIQNPHTNHGLHLEALDLQGRPVNIISLVHSGHPEHRPFVQLLFRDQSFGQVPGSRLPRSRRSHGPSGFCDENVQQNHCCRYSLIIDFRELGWDWIVAPKQANVHYCSGECPYLFHTATGAGYLASLTARNGPIPGAPCCAPTKLSDLKLLYIANGTIMQSELPGLIVDKCGCW